MTKINVDITALAKLARLELKAEELETLKHEIPQILEFVQTIQRAAERPVKASSAQRNVMRDDSTPHESGMYTERLLDAAPAREGNRVAVRQVISRKK